MLVKHCYQRRGLLEILFDLGAADGPTLGDNELVDRESLVILWRFRYLEDDAAVSQPPFDAISFHLSSLWAE